MAEDSPDKIHYTEIELQKCFEVVRGSTKVPQVKCLGCFKVRAKNTTRQCEHVKKCSSAQALMDPENTPGKRQKPLSFPTSKPSRSIDRLLAQVCFTGGRPFSLFEQQEMQDLIHALNPVYQIPSRHRIADDLLEESYIEIQGKVRKELQRSQFLNISVDETTNIRSQRVIAMTITTPTKSWFLHLHDMEDKTLDAATISEWILERLHNILLELDKVVDWKRINSISTDTCCVMKAVWQILSEKPELKHAFMIPCDSHGLQLIMKDILDPNASKIPKVKGVFKSALEVVVFFHQSPLEYARLQAKQIEKWGHRKALIAAVITRWGTQYGMLTSLYDCQEAVCEWALITPAASTIKGKEVIRTTKSHAFWWELKELIKILKPLHIAQKESEAQNSSIMEVTQRWLTLHETLRTLAAQTSFKDDFYSYLDGTGWQTRMLRQLEPLHWVAYHLDPARVPGKLDESARRHIEGALRPLQSEDGRSTAWHEFLAFRQRTGAFYNSSCWEARTPALFWLEAAEFAPTLAPFARRLCNTVANSAAAERAFSQMNLQHTKIRNRLESHRVEKLLYIQINKRQFRADSPPTVTQEMLLEEEDQEIERILQRKQVQDYLLEVLDTSDSEEDIPPDPVPNPVPNPAPEPASNPALIAVLSSALNSASTATNPALVSALNSRLNSVLNSASSPPQLSNSHTETKSVPNPLLTCPRPSASIRTGEIHGIEISSGTGSGVKRQSEWSHGVADHYQQPTQQQRIGASGNKAHDL